MSLSPFKRASSAVVAVAMAVTASACVKQDDPGVAVTKVEARLAFGIKEETKEIPTPAQAAAVAAEEGEDELLPDLPLPQPRKRQPVLKDDDDAKLCPDPVEHTADPNQANVTQLPKEGLYKWHVVLTENYSEGPKQTEQMVHRVVRRVKEIDKNRFTFETVEPLVENQFLVTLWQATKQTTVVDPNSQTGGAIRAPKAGEPERGLVIKKRQVIDQSGQEVAGSRRFEPVSGPLILPLPVTPSEAYTTAAVDSRSGDTETRSVTVGATKRVNACGQNVDGWTANHSINQTMTNGQSYAAQAELVIAPHLGGLVVFHNEQFTRPSDQVAVEVWFTMAQLKPDPLPENLK